MIDKTTLTKDSYNTLCVIYKAYLQRRKDGIPKDIALYFSDDDFFRQEHMPKCNSGDFSNSIRELQENDFLDTDVTGGFEIKNTAIILMENRFKNGLNEVFDFISKFI